MKSLILYPSAGRICVASESPHRAPPGFFFVDLLLRLFVLVSMEVPFGAIAFALFGCKSTARKQTQLAFLKLLFIHVSDRVDALLNALLVLELLCRMIQGILLILLVFLLDFLRSNPLRVVEQAVHSAFQLHCQLLSCRRFRHSISQLLVAVAPLQHASCCSHSLATHLDFNGCPFLSQFHSRGFADTGIVESSGVGDAW